MQQLRTGELISEQYKILSLIGRGGWGDVFKAEHMSLGKIVAIKILHAYLNDDQEKLERFRREARLASMIKHPYICPVFDFGVTRTGETYYVMDFIEGNTLESILEEKKTLPVETAVPVLAKLCEVLSVAHQQGVLHRDLKPSNVVIRSNGDPVLLDFGLAKLRGEKPQDHLSLTGQGTTVGTPMFMSPEQCLGETIDERSDIYSLGCILYQMLSGKPPFEAPSHLEVMRLQVRKQAAALRSATAIPDNVMAAVMQSLQKDPKDRQQTAAELREQLIGSGRPSKATRTPTGNRFTKKQMALIAGVSLSAIGAAAGCIYWSIWHRANVPPIASIKPGATVPASVTLAQVKDMVQAAYRRGDNSSLESGGQKLMELYTDKHVPADDATTTLSTLEKQFNNRGLSAPAEKAGILAIERYKEIAKPAAPNMVALEMELVQTYFLEAAPSPTLTSDWSYSPALFHAEQLLDQVYKDVNTDGASKDFLPQVQMQKERLLDTEHRFREAAAIGKQCLPALEQSSLDPRIKARAYLADALVQGVIDNVDLSLKEYQRVIDLETHGQGQGNSEVANAYSAIGQMFELRADLKQAKKYFAKAEDLFRKIPNSDPQKTATRPVMEKWQFLEGEHPQSFYQTLHDRFRSNWLAVRAQNPYLSNFNIDLQELKQGPDTIVIDPSAGTANRLNREALDQCHTLYLAANHVSDSDVAALTPLPNLKRLWLLSTDITDGVAPSLEKFRNLERLDLSITPVGHQCAVAVAKLPHLEGLSIATTQIRDPDMAPIAKCPSLERLALQETVIGDVGLKLLSKSRSLKSLDLRTTFVTDKGLQYLGTMPQLQRLEMGHVRVTGRGLRFLPKLTHLSFSAPLASEFDIGGIASMKSLRVLQLPMTPATDTDLSFLPQLQSLEEINLACTDIGDDTVALLKQLPNLKKVNLNHTKITDRALEQLSECKNLEELHIAQDNIKDIKALKNLPNLRCVSLSEDPLGADAADTLRSLPHLSRLLINGTKLPASAVMKLSRDLHLTLLDVSGIELGVDDIATLAKSHTCQVTYSTDYMTPQQRRLVQQRLLR